MSNLLAFGGFEGITDIIFSVIGTILYPLFSIVFLLIQMAEGVFKAFAGIGDATFMGQTNIDTTANPTEKEGGLVYFLLNSDVVQDLFISIMFLALFLIIIFTVMAFIKNVYAAKPKNWKDIIGGSIKGLANFIFLPVCCLLGVLLGNILLQAINGATSPNGATAMDRKLFIASAYNANRFRSNENDATYFGKKFKKDDLENLAKNTIYSGSNAGKAFSDVYTIEWHTVTEGEEEYLDPEYNEYYADIVDQIFTETQVSIYEWFTVDEYYSLWSINYLVLIAGGIFMLYVLLALAFAMVKRLFYIVILFIISPAICAMYPLDEGNAVKSWSGEVKKQVLSAYGAVAGINIFFSLIPLIEKIRIWPAAGEYFGIFNDIFQIFILVSGLIIVKDLIGLISGFVGGDNAYATGTGLMSSATKTVQKHAGSTAKKVSGTFAAAKKASEGKGGGWAGFKAGLKETGSIAGKGALTGLSNLGKQVVGVDIKNDVFETIKKEYGDKKQNVKDYEKNTAVPNARALVGAANKLKTAQAEETRIKDVIDNGMGTLKAIKYTDANGQQQTYSSKDLEKLANEGKFIPLGSVSQEDKAKAEEFNAKVNIYRMDKQGREKLLEKATDRVNMLNENFEDAMSNVRVSVGDLAKTNRVTLDPVKLEEKLEEIKNSAMKEDVDMGDIEKAVKGLGKDLSDFKKEKEKK